MVGETTAAAKMIARVDNSGRIDNGSKIGDGGSKTGDSRAGTGYGIAGRVAGNGVVGKKEKEEIQLCQVRNGVTFCFDGCSDGDLARGVRSQGGSSMDYSVAGWCAAGVGLQCGKVVCCRSRITVWWGGELQE